LRLLVTTNIVAWTGVFALAWLSINSTLKIRSEIRSKRQSLSNYRNNATEPSPASSIYTQSTRSPQSSFTSSRPYIWLTLCEYWTVIIAFFSIFTIGVPLAVAVNEPRILDAAVVWFIWMSAVKLQRSLKQSTKQASHNTRRLRAFTTLVNPVLITTLLLTAYIRAKAYATPHLSLSAVQAAFSGGSPLYAIWTSAIRNASLPTNSTRWFGAGDAALSILECGFVIWGFKLYECRRQLFSMSGVITILICIAAAAANVYLAVLTGRLMGLHKAEALAFAARNTTLALAKPAMEAVQGNKVVNAALVVSNGIVGQLLYPCILDRMGVRRSDGDGGHVTRKSSNSSSESAYQRAMKRSDHSGDDAVTIAAGVAIGINGAAMGVAYLYENKSHAAPYAALAMTTYGVMTVLFVAVDPFKAALLGLVSY
jgi:putative effector of murein hydrolase